MNMNIIFAIAELPISLIYMAIGLAMWKKPPSYKVNAGYKTELSRSSEEAWRYAQTFYGKLSGIAFAVISAAALAFNVMALVMKFDDMKGFIAFLVWIVVVFAAVTIVKGTVERRLKALFGEDGDTNE